MSTRMMRAVRGTGRTILRLVLALSLLILVALGIGPFTGRYRVVTVLTGSMRPGVPPRSLAISTPEPLDHVQVGQIITFQAPIGDHWLVTHRVIEVVSGGAHPRVRTQGDANTTADPWVAQLHNGPAWKVRTVLPGAGTAIRSLRRRWVHVATVIVAPVLFAVLTLGAIWRSANPPLHRRRRTWRLSW